MAACTAAGLRLRARHWSGDALLRAHQLVEVGEAKPTLPARSTPNGQQPGVRVLPHRGLGDAEPAGGLEIDVGLVLGHVDLASEDALVEQLARFDARGERVDDLWVICRAQGDRNARLAQGAQIVLGPGAKAHVARVEVASEPVPLNEVGIMSALSAMRQGGQGGESADN